jgi:hypothetical protein
MAGGPSIVDGRLLAPAKTLNSLLPALTSLPCVAYARIYVDGAVAVPRVAVCVMPCPRSQDRCYVSGLYTALAGLGPVEVASLGSDEPASTLAIHLVKLPRLAKDTFGDENHAPDTAAHGSKRRGDQVGSAGWPRCAGDRSVLLVAARPSHARSSCAAQPAGDQLSCITCMPTDDHHLLREGPIAPHQGSQAAAAAAAGAWPAAASRRASSCRQLEP